ncbi:carboxylesterase 15-like [Miscanthus floridulus]|uniref:carboxylesterase 15-like n=1 Tax=Miscanthus floridulus TaxID=154761 RepID=UPI00345B1DE8
MANNKLPMLVYFHGSGFCLCSFELPHFHAGTLRLAAELPAPMLSADYRLAPEHRLPAMHHDAEAVLSWLLAQAEADPWLADDSADLGRVFVCGATRPAATLRVHHVAVRYGSGQLALDPVIRIAGCILWPFFIAEERMASEAAGRPC